jgi:hypothetical protein
MTLLVAFTVAGYLVVSSYWKDAAAVSTAAAEPLDFPYLKARTLWAYWTNPPVSPDEEFPPLRKYAHVYNDAHLREISQISGVLDVTVALEQTAFSKFGNTPLISMEPQAGMWESLDLVSGRLPQNSGEVIIPESFVGAAGASAGTAAGTLLGQVISVKIAGAVMPRTFTMDSTLVETADPAPNKSLTIVGVYKARPMIEGILGYLPVNRVDSYPETGPKRVSMPWPVPNTIYLHLSRPESAANVAATWYGMYPEFPGAEIPLIPPIKVEWTPNLPEDMVREAASAVATPLFTNTLNAFSLGAIGIFAAMFVSFLDRRKELGIMKTVGIDNAHTAGAVSMEVVFSGVLGTLLGIGAAQAVATYMLKGVAGNSIPIPAGGIAAGVAVSALILVAATYVPRAMARQGTVMELLYGRAIPIIRNRR